MDNNQILRRSNNQVFFIISNKSKIDNNIEYFLNNKYNKAVKNLKKVLIKKIKYKREDFTINVFSFEIVQEDLNDKYKDLKSKKYKTIINLRYSKNLFEGIIYFNENKNNFIYDFKFNCCKGWTGNIYPPSYIKFNKAEQLKIYNDVLKQLEVKQGDRLSLDLIFDSLYFFKKNQKYYLDFYLELFKSCYLTRDIKNLLLGFKLENIMIPEKMNFNDYSELLDKIEKEPYIFIKYCSEKDNKDKYYKIFYSLLLYFRANYEVDKIQTLLNKENLSKYFAEILIKNYQYYPEMKLPKIIINEMMKQKPLTLKIIKKALSFSNSIEEILYIINANIDSISEICIKENEVIYFGEIAIQKQNGNIKEIINEIRKIVVYELKTKKTFISFEDKIWKKYIKINLLNYFLNNINKINEDSKEKIIYSKNEEIDKTKEINNLNKKLKKRILEYPIKMDKLEEIKSNINSIKSSYILK